MIKTRIALTNRRACTTLVIAAIDHFKEYNDVYGYLDGDRILREVAQAVRSTIRQYDSAFRYDGDEFALLLPGASEEEAGAIVQRIRGKVEPVMSAEEVLLSPALGFSVGVACFPDAAIERQQLITMADMAMYYAKRQGVNETYLASNLGTLASRGWEPFGLSSVYALYASKIKVQVFVKTMMLSLIFLESCCPLDFKYRATLISST